MEGFIQKQLQKLKAAGALRDLQENVKRCISCDAVVTLDTEECPHCGFKF